MIQELLALWEEYKKYLESHPNEFNVAWTSLYDRKTRYSKLRGANPATLEKFMSWLQEREKQKELEQHEIMNIE